jgi:hypothetical protein
MAMALMAGSLITGAGALFAGTTATALTIGSTALTFGQLAVGFSLAGAALSGIQGYAAGKQQAKAAQLESAARVRELNFQIQSERTQASIDNAERERTLRRNMATQMAIAGAGGIDAFSGTPITIQESASSEANRESRYSNLASSLKINQLGLQIGQTIREGAYNASSAKFSAKTSLLNTASSVVTGIDQFKELS